MEIQDTTSFEQLQAFLKKNAMLIKDENNNFMRSLIKAWSQKILSKKLIEFHEEDLAKRIDSINPNQSRCGICQTIYSIIFKQKASENSSVQEEPFSYDIGESYTSGIEFGVLI